MRLHDRVFLLLGGTGGIGKALVEPLVRAGARVIIASRHPEKLEHREGVSLVHLDLAAPDLDQQLSDLIASLLMKEPSQRETSIERIMAILEMLPRSY